VLNTKWQTTFYSICTVPKWLLLHHCSSGNDAIEAISGRLNKMWSAIWYSAHLIASNIFIGLIKSTKKAEISILALLHITINIFEIRQQVAHKPQLITSFPPAGMLIVAPMASQFSKEKHPYCTE